MSTDAWFVLGWFVCGILGAQIDYWTSRQEDRVYPWIAAFGPFTLVAMIILAVVEAKDSKSQPKG